MDIRISTEHSLTDRIRTEQWQKSGTTHQCQGRKQAGRVFFGNLLSLFTSVKAVAQGDPIKGIAGDPFNVPLVVGQSRRDVRREACSA